jgi:hypothetical protein
MCINIYAQDISEGFKIEQRMNQYSNKEILMITDAVFPVKYDLPKDLNGKSIEMNVDLPFSKVSWIADSVFNREEISKLKENRCVIELIISSAGIIKSVSYIYYNPKEEINLKKLREFAKILKQDVKANSASFKDVQMPGYFPYSIILYSIIPYDKKYNTMKK